MNNIRFWGRTLVSILFFMYFLTSYAQQDRYTKHIVQGGETLFSIASVYGTTVDEIKKNNPELNGQLKAGQTLRIVPPKGLRYHTVKKGETLYQLTRIYGTDVKTICELNPGLTETNFKTGSVIRIPDNGTPAVTATTKPTHKVKKKETLYSIAKQYGVTEQELKAANPEMNQAGYKLKKDDLIIIPKPATHSTTSSSPQAPSKGIGNIHVSVILPLKANIQEGANALDFYRGFLLAVDSMRSHGISATVHAYHSGATEADVQALLRETSLKQSDVIIGPFFQEQIPILSDYSKRNEIPLVVPFISQSRELYENPYFIQMNAPKSYRVDKACSGYVAFFKNDHTVLCGPPATHTDDFTRVLATRLSAQKMSYKQLEGPVNEESLLRTLSNKLTNTLIPTDSKLASLNALIPQLKTFIKKHPEYKIRLFGYPEWQSYGGTQTENFHYFDTYIFTTFYRNPLSPNTADFDKKFKKWFGPVTNGYPNMAMAGFDYGYFIMRQLSLQGKNFSENKMTTVAYQSPVTLQRMSNWSGFINNCTRFVHYKKDHTTEQFDLR